MMGSTKASPDVSPSEDQTDAEPDFVIAGLSVWIVGPQVYDDGHIDDDWLDMHAVAAAPGTRIEVRGSFLRRSDFERFALGLAGLYRDLSGLAVLDSPEPDMGLEVYGDGMGHITAKLQITPDYMDQRHQITWHIDQTLLSACLKKLGQLLARQSKNRTRESTPPPAHPAPR